jgi:hypothetical protein
VTSRADVDTVVTDEGVNVPLSDLGDLVPGQRVHVAVTPTAKKHRTIRGALAGKVRRLSYEDFEDVSRDLASAHTHD